MLQAVGLKVTVNLEWGDFDREGRRAHSMAAQL
jgi:hypothetical protein